MQSIEVKDAPEIPGEGKPRRNACSPDKLIDFPPEATTLYENFLHGAIAELACNQYNFVSVPLYDTLGAEALKYIMTQTELEFVFTTSNKGRVLLDMKESLPTLKTIIISGDIDQDFINRANELKVQVIDFKTVENDGKTHKAEAVNPKPDDIVTICYTSGTTGMPKGVVLTHKNLMSMVGSLMFLSENGKLIKITKDDVHISYLPLAHVYEKTSEITLIYAGAAIGFYQGDTLKLLEDIAELKPTVFVSVPRLLNRIYDKVFASVKEKSGLSQWMFTTAYNTKKNGLSNGSTDHWLWDKL
ncbi:16625_t:CDS:2, partial [Racocetra fulgida]